MPVRQRKSALPGTEDTGHAAAGQQDFWPPNSPEYYGAGQCIRALASIGTAEELPGELAQGLRRRARETRRIEMSDGLEGVFTRQGSGVRLSAKFV